MKIGILTFHRAVNYGAFLQAYALTKSVKKSVNGCNVEIIDFDTRLAQKYYLKKIIKEGKKTGGRYFFQVRKFIAFRKSIKMLPLSNEKYFTDDINIFIQSIKGKYDIIIAGSDQIWKLNGFRGFPNAYFLPGDLGCYKMSYAASSRSDIDKFDDKFISSVNKIISDFDYIGVRDHQTFDAIKKINNNLNVNINCDPVFLYDFKDELVDSKMLMKRKFHISDDKPIIGFMTHDETTIDTIIKHFGQRIHLISLFIPHKDTKNCPSLTPFEFASVFLELDFFVTSYFHGLCFAIKNAVPYCALEEKPDESVKFSKMRDLLDSIDSLENYKRIENDDYLDWIISYIDRIINNREKPDNSNISLKLKETSKSFFEALGNHDIF